MEVVVHSDEVKKDAITYKGHQVDNEERNSNPDVNCSSPGIPTNMKTLGLTLVKFNVDIMVIVIP